MKSGKVFLLILAASLIFLACKKGDTGPAGAPGSNGQPGTVNVITSKWFKADSSVWKHTALDSSNFSVIYYNYSTGLNQIYLDTQITFHAIVPTPLITAGIKDSGVVLFYYKDSTGNGVATMVGKVMPIPPI